MFYPKTIAADAIAADAIAADVSRMAAVGGVCWRRSSAAFVGGVRRRRSGA